LGLNGLNQVFVNGDSSPLGENTNIIKNNAEILIQARKVIGLKLSIAKLNESF